MTAHAASAGAAGTPQAGSAIELAIFHHLFTAIAEEMGAKLMRSAFSPNIKERRDFSCAVFDARGHMLAQAAHIPVHLGSMPLSVQAVLKRFPLNTMRPGCVYVLNDPFAGGTHLPDITVAQPVFIPGAGLPPLLVANRAHHADIGGASAGSMPLCESIDKEGLRLPPQELSSAVLEQICAASRTPAERRGDLRAQLAALSTGEARLTALCAKYGLAEVLARGGQLIAYTARLIRSLITALPDGVYEFTDYLDGDGFSSEPVRLHCAVRIAGEQAECDFRGCAAQVRGPVNAVRAITVSAVNYVFRCLAGADVPMNAGVLEPIAIVTRTGTVADALPPAAVAAGNVETSQRLVDVLLGALAQACPQRIPAASQGSMNNLASGGRDPRTGRPFTYYETIGGGAGGGPERAGASGVHTHMTNTLNTPVEALEHACPFRITRYSLREGSGGTGRHPGGDGLIRSYAFDAPATVTILSERRARGPYGLAGGRPGQPGRNQLTRADGTQVELPGKVELAVEPGDELTIETPGGGGWGEA
jgi:N-methylhydantoinase B